LPISWESCATADPSCTSPPTGWSRAGWPPAATTTTVVATQRFDLIRDGMLVAFQTVRDQTGLPRVRRTAVPPACSYADSWASVPFQRMPNVSLMPGNGPLTFDELIAQTQDGICIMGDGATPIDHQRKNFQFGGDFFWQIENGKLARPLRKVAYQSQTLPEFWSSMDAVCDSREWRLYGAFDDGKGEPVQLNPVSARLPAGAFSARCGSSTRGRSSHEGPLFGPVRAGAQGRALRGRGRGRGSALRAARWPPAFRGQRTDHQAEVQRNTLALSAAMGMRHASGSTEGTLPRGCRAARPGRGGARPA